MSKRRLRMRQIFEIMRLRYDLKCSQHAIANATGIPRSTVKGLCGRQWHSVKTHFVV